MKGVAWKRCASLGICSTFERFARVHGLPVQKVCRRTSRSLKAQHVQSTQSHLSVVSYQFSLSFERHGLEPDLHRPSTKEEGERMVR